jgi:hypothetical protein
LAQAYHVKSDEHEILTREAAVIAAKCNHLSGESLSEHLSKSALLSDWGRRVDQLREFSVRVQAWHADCARVAAMKQ